MEVYVCICRDYAFVCNAYFPIRQFFHMPLTLTTTIKNQLKFLKCEFGVNVVYKVNQGTHTRRSLLLPVSLIRTDQIVHDNLYSIIHMKPHPTCILASSAHKGVFGVESINEGQHCNFEEWISQYHTARELERVKCSILPRMHQMEYGEVLSHILEFVTPRGLEFFEVCVTKLSGRSCLVLTFMKLQGTDDGSAEENPQHICCANPRKRTGLSTSPAPTLDDGTLESPRRLRSRGTLF